MGQEAIIDGVGQIMEADLKERMKMDRDSFMLQVVTGKIKEAPFSDEALAGVRRIWGGSSLTCLSESRW